MRSTWKSKAVGFKYYWNIFYSFVPFCRNDMKLQPLALPNAIENFTKVYKKIAKANNLNLIYISPEECENVFNLILWDLLWFGKTEAEKKRQRGKWLGPFLLRFPRWPPRPHLIEIPSFHDLISFHWSEPFPALPVAEESRGKRKREKSSVLHHSSLIHRQVQQQFTWFETQFNRGASVRTKFPPQSHMNQLLFLLFHHHLYPPLLPKLTFNPSWSESWPSTPAPWLGQPSATRPRWPDR